MSTANNPAGSAMVAEQALLPAVKALAQGLGTLPAERDADEYRKYRGKNQKLWESLEAYPRMPDAMAQVDGMVRLWTEFSRTWVKQQSDREQELRTIIKLLLEAFDDLSVAKPERARQLREIGEKLREMQNAEDLRSWRGDLSDCLAEVHNEAQRQATEVREEESRDDVTSLKNRAAAEAALAQACASDTPICAVVLQLERLAFYNRRYGREVGDKVLRYLAEFVARTLVGGALYRWTGPTLVLVMPGAQDKIQVDVRRCLEPKLRCEIESGSRLVMLPIDAAWQVLPMMVDPRLLINRIDAISMAE